MNLRQIETNSPAYEQFLNLPQRIYRDDPHFRVRPVEQTRILLDPSQNPCWRHASYALFLLEDADEVIGRIAAIQDAEINRQHGRKEGFFGFFECSNDATAAAKLFGAAADWLLGQGCHSTMRGPCTPLPDFYNFGILIEGFDQPQVTGEAYNPQYYPGLFEACGMEKDADYFSFRNKLRDNKVFDRMMARLERILKKHHPVAIRAFDVENFQRDAAIVSDVLNRSFESESFYSMIDVETQEFMLRNTAPMDEMSWFRILEEDGQAAGVALTAPNDDDLLWGPNIRGMRAENFAVLPEFQRTYSASSLFYHAWDKIRRGGFEDVFISYVAEENTAMQRIAESFGCVSHKRYRIYRKAL
jgi:hypothetical protein